MSEVAELVMRFLVVGATAFGGGGAALPLVERIAVADTGWLTPQQFAVGVGFAYATPGPVLILAAFIGFYAAGVTGALAATLAVFAVPVILAAGSAGVVARLNRYARFRAFGRFAAAAAVGLLVVTAAAIARPVLDANPVLLIGAVLVVALERSGMSPIVLLVAAAALGAGAGAIGF